MSRETNQNQSASIARGKDEIPEGSFAYPGSAGLIQWKTPAEIALDAIGLGDGKNYPSMLSEFAKNQAADRIAASTNQGNTMSQTNESCGQVGRCDPRDAVRICTSDEALAKQVKYDAWKINPWPAAEQAKSAPQSQIDGLLFEQDCLLSKLSDEIYTAEGRFAPVLLPQPPAAEKAASAVEPMPSMSALAWSIHERNNRVRAMLELLRSLNFRSTVAP